MFSTVGPSSSSTTVPPRGRDVIRKRQSKYRTGRNTVRQHGFTLIEVLVVVTVSSSLLVVAVTAVAQTMQLSQLTTAEVQRIQATQLFVEQFRESGHRAIEVLCPAPEELTLVLEEDVQITFKFSDQIIRRVESQMGQVRRSEHLDLGDVRFVEFAKLEEPLRAQLTILRDHNLHAETGMVERQIESVVGLRQFLLNHSQESEALP
ncbi:prepilin-type N-terminal cleavage/methylation domain-containing protein [Aureliella helgolandensis]|uniref:Prepilin-type N-terminal cleavage/methylation domain-containing protein n=1 Tax=Aureliella helgolandensis TaxID=2527968 RepID=A0A518G7I8_9BACT|nr:prepilin-type N-terminal cleavage/methylation domain-containing protein [Aureliella helgolandensis]QDV24556.1 hypothetical protein Q31a_28760 [Aureliella helgolandensis]